MISIVSFRCVSISCLTITLLQTLSERMNRFFRNSRRYSVRFLFPKSAGPIWDSRAEIAKKKKKKEIGGKPNSLWEMGGGGGGACTPHGFPPPPPAERG